jgi:hypothetical protein
MGVTGSTQSSKRPVINPSFTFRGTQPGEAARTDDDQQRAVSTTFYKTPSYRQFSIEGDSKMGSNNCGQIENAR